MILSSAPTADAWQQAVIQELGVPRQFDVDVEHARRVAFLGNYLASQGLRSYVLGISGGVDSSTAGRLAQLAEDRLRARG
jgi:NAD+ synthase